MGIPLKWTLMTHIWRILSYTSHEHHMRFIFSVAVTLCGGPAYAGDYMLYVFGADAKAQRPRGIRSPLQSSPGPTNFTRSRTCVSFWFRARVT